MTNEALKSELRESAITMANLPTEFGVACITDAGAQRIAKALTDAATALEAMEAGGGCQSVKRRRGARCWLATKTSWATGGQ